MKIMHLRSAERQTLSRVRGTLAPSHGAISVSSHQQGRDPRRRRPPGRFHPNTGYGAPCRNAVAVTGGRSRCSGWSSPDNYRSLLATSPRIYAKPAVDWYLRTGDVARSIRREEDDEISDLRDFRPPFEQDTLALAELTNKLFCAFSLSFTELFCPGLTKFSADEAGNDGINSDFVDRQIGGLPIGFVFTRQADPPAGVDMMRRRILNSSPRADGSNPERLKGLLLALLVGPKDRQ